MALFWDLSTLPHAYVECQKAETAPPRAYLESPRSRESIPPYSSICIRHMPKGRDVGAVSALPHAYMESPRGTESKPPDSSMCIYGMPKFKESPLLCPSICIHGKPLR